MMKYILLFLMCTAALVCVQAREHAISSNTRVTVVTKNGAQQVPINASAILRAQKTAGLRGGLWSAKPMANFSAAQSVCGNEHSEVPEHIAASINNAILAQSKGVELAQLTNDTLQLEVAVEIDHLLYQRMNKSTDDVLAYVDELFTGVNAIYSKDLATKVVVTNVRVWEDVNDPYSDTESVFALIESFIAEYETNMDTVHRDIAVFLTSRTGGGGIAGSIGGICTGRSYCAGDVQLQMLPYPQYSWDLNMVAHEIGHVGGGIHTQSCFWPGGPLDSCITSESGACVTQSMTRPTPNGTLMSYCHQNAAATVKLEFHPLHKFVIRDLFQRTACVGNMPADPKAGIIRGKLLNAKTNAPIAGAELSISSVVDDSLYMGTPLPGGAVATTTSADGGYEFRELGRGLYNIKLPPNLSTLPVQLEATGSGVNVMLASELAEQNIYVLPGEQVALQMEGKIGQATVAFHVFSELLENGYKNIPAPGYVIDAGYPIAPVLPEGNWIVVPQAAGILFEPRKLTISVSGAGSGQSFKIKAVSTAPDTLTTLVAFMRNVEQNPNGVFAGGDSIEFEAREAVLPAVVRTVIPDDGIVLLDSVQHDVGYGATVILDTTLWAPCTDMEADIYGEYLYAFPFTKRLRTYPLTARPYILTVSEQSYAPPAGSEVIMGEDVSFSVPSKIVTLPFTFAIGNKSSNQVTVYRNGSLVVGNNELSQYEAGLRAYSKADIIFSALGSELEFDSVPEGRGSVRYIVQGEAPNRQAVFEWKNLRMLQYTFDNGVFGVKQTGDFNFMIILNEDESVEYVYGNNQMEPGSVIYGSIGIRGADVLDYNSISGLFSSSSDWSEAVSSTTVLESIYFSNESVMPEGLSFKWNTPLTGIDDTDQPFSTVFVVSPNPATNTVMVSNVPVGSTVRIVSMVGVEVAAIKTVSSTAQLNTRELAAGMYTVQCSLNGKLVSQPLVIVR